MPKRLIILYLCLYIAMIGYGLSLPVLPFFLRELAQYRDLTSAKISLHVGAITAIFAFMQMVFAPFWGKLSDFTGRRRPILLSGLAGYAISMALAGISKNIIMLYGARMLNGVFSAAVLPIAGAYVVDVVSKEHRARGLAWHGTAVGLGVVTGPALGAYFSALVARHPLHLGFIEANDFSTPFLLASILAVFPLIIAGIWLPESFSGNSESPLTEMSGAPAVRQETPLSDSVVVYLLLALTSQFALSLFEGTFVLHAGNVMNFTAAQLGSVFMVCGFVMAVAQGTTIAGFIERFGAGKILPYGFLFMGAALVALMGVRTLNQILFFVGILALGMAVISPSVAVLISHRAEDRLGKTLGLLTGANSIGQTLGPLLGSMLFIYNIHLPYLLAACALFFAAWKCFIRHDLFRE